MSGSVPVPSLSRADVDRAAHRRGDDVWLAQAWPTALVLVLDAELSTPISGERPALAFVRGADAPLGERYFLGEAGSESFFAVVTAEAPGESAAGLREVGSALDDRDSGLFVAAVALARWHAVHGCCPRCGAPTRVISAGWVRECERDGSHHFPRVDPAMIVLVHDGADRCLLGRQASWPEGRFSTLAGFVEPGESAEMAVRREVAEETSVPVGDIRYVSSQPWPFPSSLMLGFTARALDVRSSTIGVDGEEIADARWFTRDEVVGAAEDARNSGGGWAGGGWAGRDGLLLPSSVSIAHRLVTGWASGDLP